jgi:hypothetical protein
MSHLRPGQPFVGGYKKPFWQTPGCAAFGLFIALIALVGGAFIHFLKIPLHLGPTVSGTRIPTEMGFGADAKAGEVPDDIAGQIKQLSVQFINGNFGPGIIAEAGVDVKSITDKSTQGSTYLASGNFPGFVDGQNVNVQWELAFVSDGKSGYLIQNKEAYYATTDGVAQYDFSLKKFIRLDH